MWLLLYWLGVCYWGDVVHLAILLHLCKYSMASLRRNQAGHDFLSYIFGRSSQQIFQLNRTEFLDNRALFADALMKSFFKLIQFSFLLIKILNQPSSSLLHFMKSALQSFNNANKRSFNLNSILRMPNIVSDELFNSFLPLLL